MAKCLYCDKDAEIKGYCAKHYKYLNRIGVDVDNIQLCLDMLKKRDKGKPCIYCGDKHYGRGYCKRHYFYLKRHKIDLNDTDLCLLKLKLTGPPIPKMNFTKSDK